MERSKFPVALTTANYMLTARRLEFQPDATKWRIPEQEFSSSYESHSAGQGKQFLVLSTLQCMGWISTCEATYESAIVVILQRYETWDSSRHGKEGAVPLQP